jgi:acetyl-CoA/propionyl-CoA carboxylase biotin carboxyl carrier protein
VKVWLPDAPVARASSGGGGRSRPRPSAAAHGDALGGDGTISAPMQGTIVKVLVAVGDAVDAGQAVIVLEAMKMENHINAEKAGTVAEIRVAPGDGVGTGDVLAVIE